MTNTVSTRAASGARLLGDDVQHLIVWYHVLRTQRVDSTTIQLAVEAAGVGNVDDLTVLRSDGPDEYWQVKASVDASTPLNEAWLLHREHDKPSLLQRLHASWRKLRARHPESPHIVLATTKAIDPTDPVLGPRATTDARIIDTMRSGTGRLAEARGRWADHLEVDEPELLEFLDCFQVRHGQSEREWREKVQDAAAGARLRTDDAAVVVGLQQVRDWVKAPRQAFSASDLAATIDELGLRVPATRALLVAQMLERNPRAETATYSIDWFDLLAGEDPRSRRTFAAPAAADRILADLATARSRLRAANLHDVEVDGPMRLPLWFTIGTQLGATAGFTLRARAGGELWSSTTNPAIDVPLDLLLPDNNGDFPIGRPWVVSVSVSIDIADDVDEYVAHALPDAGHLRARVPQPGPAALTGAAHARAVAIKLRDGLRVLRRRLRPSELHLFLALPGAGALLLGHVWDRMPATWTYWDLGQPGLYARALRVVN